MTLLNSHALVLDKKLAVVLGLNEALVLQQMDYWLGINKKKNRNFHEGRYWTYNTINNWQEEFPFWSKSTIKRIFKKLRKMNLLETENFNVYQMDRTLWYTINYEKLEELCNSEISSIDFTEEDAEDKNQNNQPIRSDKENHNSQNKPMEKSKETLPLPENSTKTSTEISNQSINPSEGFHDNVKYLKDDRKIDRPKISYNNFKIKYDRIIHNCDVYAIDEKYREAIAHAIKLLLLDIEKGDKVRIEDNYIPTQIVEDDIKRLNFFVIEHAVNKFKEISRIQEIRNPVGYLKVLIYNSINEVQIDVDSKLRHEGLIG